MIAKVTAIVRVKDKKCRLRLRYHLRFRLGSQRAQQDFDYHDV